MNKSVKLDDLMDFEGFDDRDEFLDYCMFDSIVPAICTNEACDYTASLEPDSTAGWYEACNTNTMVSRLILAGVI